MTTGSLTPITEPSTTLPTLLEHVPSLLQGFAAFDNAALPAAIDHVLARLGRIVAVDRTYLFRLWRAADGRQLMDNDHEWCAPGITPQIDELRGLPVEIIDTWLPDLTRGAPVYIPRVQDLPPDRADRANLEAQGIRSLLVTPMIGAGELIGFLGFDAVRAERRWSPGERLLLGVVADAICSAQLRQQALREVSDNARRFRILAEHSSDLGLVVGVDGDLLDVSPSAAALMGWHPQEMLGVPLAHQVHPEDQAHLRTTLRRARSAPATAVETGDLRLRCSDGGWRWFSATAVDLCEEPTLAGMVLVAHDIDDRKRAEAEVAHQALHDPLTGLPNRALLGDRLEGALERARRHGDTVAVVFLDLDRFKVVNDSLGHAHGDELLQACARRLQQAVREVDTVARFGGDEFVVLLDATAGPEDAWHTAERILSALEQPLLVGDGEHHVTASAGCVIADTDSTPQQLLRDADAAMYQAKSAGRDQLRGLDEQLRSQLLEETALVDELHGIRSRGEMTVEYQPIVGLTSGTCVGYEALVRWDHPRRGRIGPDRFVPLAEEHGLIAGIGDAVLVAALEQLTTWDRRDPEHRQRRMAINLSVHQLHGQDLVRRVQHLLAHHDLPGERLVFELTESTLMAEPDSSRQVLSELRRLGCGVAIDDFGTGYSSLSYLCELPVSMLKIDRSFVARIGESERAERVVSVVLTLAHEFGLDAVAEGIETSAQRRTLERLGCDFGQGYLLGRPASPAALEAHTFMPMARSSSRT